MDNTTAQYFDQEEASVLVDNGASSFLVDVQHNLMMIRQLYGSRSRQYMRLVGIYREVANATGCRPELDHIIHPLRRRRMIRH